MKQALDNCNCQPQTLYNILSSFAYIQFDLDTTHYGTLRGNVAIQKFKSVSTVKQ